MSIIRRSLLGLLLVAIGAPAGAEQAEINVAQQYGVSFLPLMLMERDKRSTDRHRSSSAASL